jgi:TatD DNase family protein
MLIDTHCHLNFKAFYKDLDLVIKRAKNVGVDKIIIPGAKLNSSQRAIEIANTYNNCFASVGIHPHHVDEFYNIGKVETINSMKKMIFNKRTVAVGEIGLDYHDYKNYPKITTGIKNIQKELFLSQINLALEFKLPVIIHGRDSYEDVIDIVSDIMKNGMKLRGVFHCFSGNEKQLETILTLGFYIGFDGNITYPENEYLKKAVNLTPLENLLIESDSPYLTPIPYRHSRNEPSYIINTVKTISKIKNVYLEKINFHTTQNAVNLFHI